MKLHNVYRICKQNIDFFHLTIITENKTNNCYQISHWQDALMIFNRLNKVPVLKKYINNCINSIPSMFQDLNDINTRKEIAFSLRDNMNILHKKMYDIIELYESMNLENDGNGLDIKLPPCEDLKEYISYLKDLDFIFSQCPYLQCEDEILKFRSVDIGSNWIKLTIAGASTCLLLTNVASLVDKSIILRSHYITLAQQEELLKSQQLKNELAEENFDTFKILKKSYMDIIINDLQKECGQIWNSEEFDKAERSLEKLIILLEKGTEIYATLDSPEEIQALFPEIQGNLELPDSIIKYLEEKENIPE